MKKLWMMPLLILILAACQSNTVEEAEKHDRNEVNEQEENQNENNEETEVAADLSLYDHVLKEYEALTEMSMEEAENASFDYVKSGGLFYFYEGGIHEGLSAAYYDLNGDGVDELIITLGPQGSHSLIDLYSIVDGQLVSIFTDDMSAAAMMKRSGYSLTKKGNLIYMTASGQGDRYGKMYELNEATMEYVEIYRVSQAEGDFAEIEKELENKIDFASLDWERLENKAGRMIYESFQSGDYAALEGVWENGNEESVTIKGNEITFMDGRKLSFALADEYSDEKSYHFAVSVENENDFPPRLIYYPENMEIKLGEPVLLSDTNQSRITITYAGAPGEEDVFYKVSE